ncbi:MAG: hypothetical protein WCI73_10060 [Phycisphaerae bacterium]
MTLVNASADVSGDFPLRLASSAETARLVTPDKPAPVPIKLAADGETHRMVTVPGLGPWGMCALRLD